MTEDYVVCNHDTNMWEPFHAIDDTDFIICGMKPCGLGITQCNYETEKWEQVSAVYPPSMTVCGTRPEGMSENAVCDSETGKWNDLIMVS